MNALNANAQQRAAMANERQGSARREPEPAKAGDVVMCLVCSGKGYVYSLRHVVCRECKGTRTVTIQVYT